MSTSFLDYYKKRKKSNESDDSSNDKSSLGSSNGYKSGKSLVKHFKDNKEKGSSNYISDTGISTNEMMSSNRDYKNEQKASQSVYDAAIKLAQSGVDPKFVGTQFGKYSDYANQAVSNYNDAKLKTNQKNLQNKIGETTSYLRSDDVIKNSDVESYKKIHDDSEATDYLTTTPDVYNYIALHTNSDQKIQIASDISEKYNIPYYQAEKMVTYYRHGNLYTDSQLDRIENNYADYLKENPDAEKTDSEKAVDYATTYVDEWSKLPDEAKTMLTDATEFDRQFVDGEIVEGSSNDEKLKQMYGWTDEQLEYYKNLAKNIDSAQSIVDYDNKVKNAEDMISSWSDSDLEMLDEIINYNKNTETSNLISDDAYSNIARGIQEDVSGERQQIKDNTSYLAQKYGEDNLDYVMQYRELMNDKQATEEFNSEVTKLMKNPAGNIGANVLDIAGLPLSGYGTLDLLKQKAEGKDFINTYGSANFYNNFDTNVINTENDLISQNSGALGETGDQMLYGIANSTAKSLYSMFIGGGVSSSLGLSGEAAKVVANAVTLPMFGSSSFNSRYQEDIERGLGEDAAIEDATANGIAEMLFEVVSLDKGWDILNSTSKATAKKALVNMFVQAGIEGTEEGFTDLADWAADKFVNGDFSEYNALIRDFVSQGYSEEEAKELAWKNYKNQFIQDMIAGAASGGISGGILTGVNYASTYNTVQKLSGTNAEKYLYESAKTQDKGSDAYKIANSTALEDMTDNQKVLLYQSMNSIASDSDVRESIVESLMENGETRNQAEVDADYLLNMTAQNPEEITEEEAEANETKLSDNNAMAETYAGMMTGEGEFGAVSSVRALSNEVARQQIENEKQKESAKEEKAAQKAESKSVETYYKQHSSLSKATTQDGESVEIVKVKSIGETIDGTRLSIRDSKGNFKTIMASDLDSDSVNDIATAYYDLVAYAGTKNVTDTAMNNILSEVKNRGPVSADVIINSGALAYQAGLNLGTTFDSFESFAKSSKSFGTSTALVNKAFLETMFNNGKNVAEEINARSESKENARLNENARDSYVERDKTGLSNKEKLGKVTIVENGTEKTTEQYFAEHPSDDMTEMYVKVADMVAKRLGISIAIGDSGSFMDDHGNFSNGYFISSMGRLAINTDENVLNTLGHELSEFAEAYNKEKMDAFIRKVMEYAISDVGEENVSEAIAAYRRAYEKQHGKSLSNRDVNKEIVNDIMGGMLFNKKGMTKFNSFINETVSDEEERKSLKQTFLDILIKIRDFFRDLINNNKMYQNEGTAIGRRMWNNENHANELVDEWLKLMGEASDNLAASTEGFSTVEEEQEATEHSIDTFLSSIGLTFEKAPDGRTILRNGSGKEVKRVTPTMVQESLLGDLLDSTVRAKFISQEEMVKQSKMVSDLINLMLKTQDIDLLWAVSTTVGFNPIKPGARDNDTREKIINKSAALTKNSDPQYSSTIDFTTICVKTQAVIDAMSQTMMRLGRGLSEDEIIKIVYDEVYNADEPVPCPVCYVFSRWVGLGGLFNRMKELQIRSKDMSAKDITDELARLDVRIAKKQEEIDGKKTKSKAKDQLHREIKAEYDVLDNKRIAFESHMPGSKELTSDQKSRLKLLGEQLDLLDNYTWYKDVRSKKNYKPVPDDILFDINAGNKFASEYPAAWKWRTTRGPAMGKAATPYAAENLGQFINGIAAPSKISELGKMKAISSGNITNPFVREIDDTGLVESMNELNKAAKAKITNARANIKAQNLLNGQRMQSTSDFRFEYVLDYLTVFFEMQSIGAKVQLYTKVTESVPMFASINAEVNCSLMPLGSGIDKNGNLAFSSVTGMDPVDAFALSAMYNNVQPILVGVSKEHIMLALDDDRITFVIPYHASGANEDRYKSLMRIVKENVTSRTNFEEYQTDHFKSSRTAEQEAAWKLRMAILMGKASTLTSEQKSMLSDSKYSVLRNLYMRRYGVDENGNIADIDEKYLLPSERNDHTKDSALYKVNLKKDQAEMIMPFEYWDQTSTIENAYVNGDAFREYCDLFGIEPRFSGYTTRHAYKEEGDFTASKGYWKVLIDRAMYNNDGSYHEQKAINVTGFSNSYVTKEGVNEYLKDEMNYEINKPTKTNDKRKTRGIVDKAINRIQNEQFESPYEAKITDSMNTSVMEEGQPMFSINVTKEENDRYMELAKEPEKNSEKLQKMVDDAARKAGFTRKLYHGSHANDIHIFKTNEINNNMGSHFGSKDIAEGFASDEFGHGGKEGKIYSVWVKADNPYDTYDWFAQDDAYPTLEAIEMAKKINTKEAWDVIDRIKKNTTAEIAEMMDDHNLLEESYLDTEDQRETLYQGIRDLLDLGGWDSIRYENMLEIVGDIDYIVQHPNQIKSADPVTYDDEGNIIPLSERFNDESEDIRYSVNVVKYNREYKNRDYLYTENSGIIKMRYSSAVSKFGVAGLSKSTYDEAVKEVSDEVEKAFKELNNVIFSDMLIKNGYIFVYENFEDTEPQWLAIFKQEKGLLKNVEQIQKAISSGSDTIRVSRRYRGGYTTVLRKRLSSYIFDGLSSRLSYKGQTGINEDLRRNLEDVFRKSKIFRRGISGTTLKAYRELIDNYSTSEDESLSILSKKKYSDLSKSQKEKIALTYQMLLEKSLGKDNSVKFYEENLKAYDDVSYSINVTDQKTLDFLNNQDYVTTYKTMRKIGEGQYVSPMASKINGKYEMIYTLGSWAETVEHPELIKVKVRENGKDKYYSALEHPELIKSDESNLYFALKKDKNSEGKSGSVDARYNPYEHSSNSVFNDQFDASYKEPTFVTIEMHIPKSELTSGYKAKYAKDPVGFTEWKAGSVSNALAKSGKEARGLYLSRWAMPARELSAEETAIKYVEALEGTDVKIGWNTVPPAVLKELQKIDAPIDYSVVAKGGTTYEDAYGIDKNFSINVPHEGTVAFSDSVFNISDYEEPEEETWADGSTTISNAKYLHKAADVLSEGTKLLEGKTLDKTSINKIAKKLVSRYNSTIPVKDVAENLTKAFAYMNEYGASHEAMLGVMNQITRGIVNTATKVDPAKKELYDNMRNHLKHTTIRLNSGQIGELKHAGIGLINGYVNFSGTKGEPLDQAWDGIIEASGNNSELIAISESDAGQAVALVNYMKSIYPVVENKFDGDDDEVALSMAMEIFGDFYHEFATDQRISDKEKRLNKAIELFKKSTSENYKRAFQEELDKQKQEKEATYSKLRAAAQEILNTLNSPDADSDVVREMLKAQKAEYEARMKDLRSENDKKIAEIKAHNRTVRQNEAERRKNTELKNELVKRTAVLQKMVTKPTAEGHVQKRLLLPTIDVLEAIDLETGKCMEMSKKLANLSEIYQRYKDDPKFKFSGDYDERTLGMIKKLKTTFEGKNYTELTNDELTDVIELVKALTQQIRNENRFIANAKAEDAFLSRRAVIMEINSSRGIGTSKIEEAINKYNTWQLNAYREFHKLSGYNDDSLLMSFFEEFQRGELTELEFQRQVSAMFEKVLAGKENQKAVKRFNSIDEKDLVDVGLKDKAGNPVLVTRAMRMSLAFHALNDGNLRHILGGGVTVPNMKAYKNGEYDRAYNKLGNTYKYISDETSIELSKAKRNYYSNRNQDTLAALNAAQEKYDKEEAEAIKTLKGLVGKMDEWEKEYYDIASYFFHEFTGNAINNITQKIRGYYVATVNNYFPIKTDPNFTKVEWTGLITDASLEGWGNLKERVHASNPILLEDISNVVMRQTSKTAQYVGNSIPLRDFNMLTQGMVYEGDNVSSVREVIQKKWSSYDMEFLKRFVQDLSGGRPGGNEGFANLCNALRGNFAGATLTANFGVAIKQAASYPTAAAVLGYGPLLKATKDMGKGFLKKGIPELEAINPLVWNRVQGNSSAEIAYAKQSDFYRFLEDNKALHPVKAISVDLIQNVDTATVTTLEYASMYYVDSNFKDLKKGTDAYWRKVSEVFTDVITQTQPNYTTLDRPEILRNTNQLLKQLVMFKTQPLQNFGIVYDSFGELRQRVLDLNKLKKDGASEAYIKAMKDKRNEAVHRFSRAISSQLAAAVTFSLMTIASNIFYHKWWKYKDDDKDQTMLEQMLTSFLSGIASTLFGSLTFGDLIYQLIDEKLLGGTYYGLSVNITELINDTKDDIDNLAKYIGKLNKSETDADVEQNRLYVIDSTDNLMANFLKYFGIPYDNIENTLKSLYMYGNDLIKTISGEDVNVFDEEDPLSPYQDIENMKDRYLDAFGNDDMDEADRLFEQMVSTSDAEDPESSTKQKILNTAYDEFKNGTMGEDYLRNLMSHFGMDEQAIDEKVYELQTGTSSINENMKNAMNSYIEDPTDANRKEVLNAVNDLKELGKTKEQIGNSVSSTYKQQYLDATGSEKANIKSIISTAWKAAGYTQTEIDKKFKNWNK